MSSENISFGHLWLSGVYDIDNYWDRLRTIGSVKDLDTGISTLNFFPIRQKIPALSEKTRPEMKDPSTAQILAEYNHIKILCELFSIKRYCFNMLDEDTQTIGENIKYLLRMSNISYPHLFDDIEDIPVALSQIGEDISLIYKGVPMLDIQAYNETILITGGPIGKPEDWPFSHLVEEVDYPPHSFNFRGFIGKNILLPSTIEDLELGNLILAVWKAKKNSLDSK